MNVSGINCCMPVSDTFTSPIPPQSATAGRYVDSKNTYAQQNNLLREQGQRAEATSPYACVLPLFPDHIYRQRDGVVMQLSAICPSAHLLAGLPMALPCNSVKR